MKRISEQVNFRHLEQFFFVSWMQLMDVCRTFDFMDIVDGLWRMLFLCDCVVYVFVFAFGAWLCLALPVVLDYIS